LGGKEMKASSFITGLVSGGLALALGGVVTYGATIGDPEYNPAPSIARDTSITQQVISTIAYVDQQGATALSEEFVNLRDELLTAADLSIPETPSSSLPTDQFSSISIADVARASGAATNSEESTSDAAAATESSGTTSSSAGGSSSGSANASSSSASSSAGGSSSGSASASSSSHSGKASTSSTTTSIITSRKELTMNTTASSKPLSINPSATLKADTINVNGTTMAYVDSYKTSSAPTTGAGLWMGSDSTDDGSWGYFIGHNPGSFTCVMALKNGDPVTICDSAGKSRTYHVIDEFVVPDTTYWEDIQTRVTSYGESVILQTCCGDNAHYRVVIAV
jgi:hypothetical protein